MQNSDLYTSAHLVVAAIRILEHQHSAPPSIEQVCQALSFSVERGNFICNKLREMTIIEVIEGAFGTRLSIKDHLKIEDIPKHEKISSLADELKKFQNSRKDFTRKIESIQAEKAKKKKDLFAELDKKLKIDKNKKPT